MARSPVNRPELTTVANKELDETFVDSLVDLVFDGNTFRLEFAVNRIDMTSPTDQRTGERVPVSRLVLPTPGFIDLCNKLNRMMAALEKQGIVKQSDKPAGEAEFEAKNEKSEENVEKDS